jgi:hypothetical protein
MFSDHPVNVEIPYGYKPDKFPSLDANAEIGRYLQLKIGDEDRLRGRGPLIFTQAGFGGKSQVQLEPSETKVNIVEYRTLMAVGEKQELLPQRFVKIISVSITNQCAPYLKIRVGKRDIKASFSETPGDEVEEELDVSYGRPYKADPVQGIAPGENAFAFRLSAPI